MTAAAKAFAIEPGPKTPHLIAGARRGSGTLDAGSFTWESVLVVGVPRQRCLSVPKDEGLKEGNELFRIGFAQTSHRHRECVAPPGRIVAI